MPKSDVPPLWREIKKGAATNPVLQKVLDRHQQGWTKEQALLEAVLTLATIKAADIAKMTARANQVYETLVTGTVPALSTVSEPLLSFEAAKKVIAARLAEGVRVLEQQEQADSPLANAVIDDKPVFSPNREIKEGSDSTCADGAHSEPGEDGRCRFCGRIVGASNG